MSAAVAEFPAPELVLGTPEKRAMAMRALEERVAAQGEDAAAGYMRSAIISRMTEDERQEFALSSLRVVVAEQRELRTRRDGSRERYP